MNNQPYQKTSIFLFCIVILGAFVVLVGWVENLPILKTVAPGLVSMKANTALGFIALGFAGLFIHHNSRRAKHVISFLSFAAFAMAFTTLIEYAFKLDLHIDELFFSDPEAMLTRWPPGRPAPITAISFILISSSLWMRGAGKDSIQKIRQGFVISAWLISFQAFIGYLIGVTYSFGSAFYTQIAVHTALLFILLCFGVILAEPKRGVMQSIFGTALSGILGRRLLVSALFIPPLLNWIQLKGITHGYWDQDFGTLVLVVGNVVFFAWAAIVSSSELLAAEQKRKQAEDRVQAQTAKLEASRSKLNVIANAVPAFISYVESDRRYSFANSAYLSWFGFDSHEVVGKDMKEVLGTAFPTAENYVQQALTGQTIRYQNSVITPNGEKKIFEADYVPELGPDQEVKGFVVIGHDVTERVNSEAKLEEAVRARDELLSICSHELRTPITSMKLSAQIVKRDLEKNIGNFDAEKIKKMVTQSVTQLDRLTRLIEEMLDFSRISKGLLKITPEQVDLGKLCQDTIARMQAQFDKAEIKICFHQSGTVFGNWDHFRLEQVVTNLLSNAIKYGKSSSIEVSLNAENEWATVSVSDEGFGISQADQKRIFNPYERAVASESISGLGLGLYISNEIIHAHGGRIEVESVLGKGSVFTVYLPLS